MGVLCKVCKKTVASYGIDGKVSRCAKHKDETMQRVKTYVRFCIEDNCTTEASYNYENESRRLYCSCVFIRFNPDAYTDENGKRVKSCFSYHKRFDIPCVPEGKEWNRRTLQLQETITNYLYEIPQKEITTEYLFYNKNS
jgi:hypothetical protein